MPATLGSSKPSIPTAWPGPDAAATASASIAATASRMIRRDAGPTTSNPSTGRSTTIGRDSGRACPHVVGSSDRRTLEGLVQATTAPGAVLNTDEWRAYGRVSELGWGQVTVNDGAGEWARDEDGDGIREVHVNNTMEGTWTRLRNFLRPFRGVSKWHQASYLAIFEWANNI